MFMMYIARVSKKRVPLVNILNKCSVCNNEL